MRHARQEQLIVLHEIYHWSVEINGIENYRRIVRYHQSVLIYIRVEVVRADPVVLYIKQMVVAYEYRMVLEIEIEIVFLEHIVQSLGIEERRDLLEEIGLHEHLGQLLALVVDKRADKVAAPRGREHNSVFLFDAGLHAVISRHAALYKLALRKAVVLLEVLYLEAARHDDSVYRAVLLVVEAAE